MALMFLTRKRNKLSNINLSHVSPTTLAPGNLIPISFTRIINDRQYRFKPSSFVQAFPMKAPLVNGFKVCYEYFFIPDRLYNSDLLLDFDGTTDEPDSVNYPTTDVVGTSSQTIDLSSSQDMDNIARLICSPGSLADYMGVPPGFLSVPTAASGAPSWNIPKINVIKALGYLDVVYNYYVNQQIDVIPTASYRYVSSGAYNTSLQLDTLRTLLKTIKRAPDPVVAIKQFITDWVSSGTPIELCPLSWQWLCSRNSILQRCLPPYYLESWLKTSGYEDSEIKVDLDDDGTGNYSIAMRNISGASHIQRWVDLCLSGGSRWSDYQNAQFDCSRVKNSTVPIFLGADRQYLGSNVIYQTTGFDDSDSPLGSFAGQASGGDSFRERVFSFGEPGYFMVMASLVPDVVYGRGLDPFLEELTLGDSYAPALDNIAMEPLLTKTLDVIPRLGSTNTKGFSLFPVATSAAVGFVPAWSKLMQQVSRSHGRLTTELAYWLLERDYGVEPSDDNLTNIRTNVASWLAGGNITYDVAEAILALMQRMRKSYSYSPYVRPNAYNGVFADQSNEAQNFVLTFSCRATALREKSKTNVTTTL